jgi:protein gp37
MPTEIQWTDETDIQLHPDRLEKPLHWRKPRRVFVNSLSDLFHEAIPDEYIARVFETMRCAPTHTFQVLTKRPERAREWFSRCGDDEGLGWITHDGTPPGGAYSGTGIVVGDHDRWPLPNVWVGVSIEDSSVTWRADVLREIPAAVRFISAEPLLGSLFDAGSRARPNGELGRPRELTASRPDSLQERADASDRARDRAPLDLTGIDWIIVGGESGPRARPFHLEHAREIIEAAHNRCECEHVAHHRRGSDCGSCTKPAVFVKQLGAKPISGGEDGTTFAVDLRDRKGGDWDEWPADLRIREFPASAAVLA